jgi:3',5'-cyclic AMP phosphodiesterase CpdA
MSLILHASDPHFGTERPEVVGALLELSTRLRPQVLVLSGDITQRARRAQFQAARRFASSMSAESTLVIPGNHDLPLFNLIARLAAPYAGYRAAFGDTLEPTLSLSDCLIVGVNTTRRYRHVDGEISARQCRRVAERLKQATPEQTRIVVLHQPVAVPRASELHNVCHGSEPAVRAWAEAGADLIVAGHIHLPFVLPLAELFGGLGRPVWAVNAGTAVSTRVRLDAGNSVNVLRTSEAGAARSCAVERWSFSAPTSSFVCVAELRLSLG